MTEMNQLIEKRADLLKQAKTLRKYLEQLNHKYHEIDHQIKSQCDHPDVNHNIHSGYDRAQHVYECTVCHKCLDLSEFNLDNIGRVNEY